MATTVYATVADVQQRMTRQMTAEEQVRCAILLGDAAVMIDSYNANASDDAKRVVSCRMLVRVMDEDGTADYPTGASQGSMSGLGYSQSWTMASGGGTGELYIGKAEKQLLGVGNHIGSYSPTQELVPQPLPEVIA